MIVNALERVLADAVARAGLPVPPGGIDFTVPRQREHGDFATNVALQLAKAAGAPPRSVAERIRDAIDASDHTVIERVEIAGPGFLNVFLASTWMHDVLQRVVDRASEYGRGDELAGQRINLEFVSANPTGPLHAGGGRWVAVGDAIANLLSALGADVHREYYLNDAGTQLDLFGASLRAAVRGEDPPEDGYRGAYIVEMAARLSAELGPDVTLDAAREWGYHDVVRQLRDDLGRIGVHFDTWFSERLLHERGDVAEVLAELRSRGHTYEHEGAEWLRSTDFGDSRDRVLVRSDGTTTYLCNDLAYHRDKFARGWTHLIDIWGADHHGQVKSLQTGLGALGHGGEPPEPEIILGQLVKLVRHGEPVRMSKRSGNVITLADILDEVDADVARMTFLLQGIDTVQTFDLDVVTQQSSENPVFYVQYAHARIASIGRRAEAAGVVRLPLADVDLSALAHEREHDLLRALHEYPAVVRDAATMRAPQKLTTWVRDFAARFHAFYRDCRVLTDDPATVQARLWLVEACRIGLANALALLGVSAPEVMERADDDGATDAAPNDDAATDA